MISVMTKDQLIADLLAERTAVLDELHGLVAGGGPDSQKEALADRFNGLTEQLRGLGYHPKVAAPAK
jgi:hypothetical protein